MKKLFAYFKHPTESIAKEDSASVKSLFLFFLLIQGIYLLTAIPFAIAGIAPKNELQDIKSYGLPFLFFAFVPPILEELSFRLSLKRKRVFFMISLAFICWIVISKIFSAGSVYSAQHLWLRLSLSIPLGILLGYLLCEPLQKMNFGVWFYTSAFLFGFIHIFNYADQIISFGTALFVFFYLLNKVAMGLFLGYIRIRYSIFASIAIHFLNNFLPLMAVYSAI